MAITASGEVYGEAKPGTEVSVEGIEVWVGTGVTVHQDDSMASGIRIEGGATPKDKAIEDAVCKEADAGPPWSGFIHPELVMQMTNAAEQVFDAAMDAQAYQASEQGGE